MGVENAENWLPVKSKIERFLGVTHFRDWVKAMVVKNPENWFLLKSDIDVFKPRSMVKAMDVEKVNNWLPLKSKIDELNHFSNFNFK